MAQRFAQTIGYINGSQTYYRGPSIGAITEVNSTHYDVTITQVGGTDITASSSLTGWQVLDSGTLVTVTSVARQSATSVRITLAIPIVGTISVRYMYGGNPTVTTPVYDNASPLSLPLENAISATPPVTGPLTVSGGTTGTPELTASGGSGTYSWSTGVSWVTCTTSGTGNSVCSLTTTALPLSGTATIQVNDGTNTVSEALKIGGSGGTGSGGSSHHGWGW